LPDRLFSNQKYKLWVNFGWPWSGKCWYILWPFGLFYGHLVYFMVYFGLFWVRLVNFFPFWYVLQRKIWQHWASVAGNAFGKATKNDQILSLHLQTVHSLHLQFSLIFSKYGIKVLFLFN
jgi:hypothetical protein